MTVKDNVLSGRIYQPAGTLSVPIPKCALEASTYVDSRFGVERPELVGTVALPRVELGGGAVVDLGELTLHVRENINAPGFGTVEALAPDGGYVAGMWQTLWSNEDPEVNRPEFPEGGLVYEDHDPASGEICDDHTFSGTGDVMVADKYTDETHWTRYWTSPMTVWASFDGDGEYEIRVPTISEWRDGGWSGCGGDWSNDFMVPMSGPATVRWGWEPPAGE